MGVVYQITFPDGTFYIGATINLKNRIMQHRYHASNKNLKAKIKEYKMSKDEFIQLFVIIYEGDHFQDIEKETIQNLKETGLCLNIAGVKYYHKRANHVGPRRLHCTVQKSVYVMAEALMEEMGLDTKELITMLIKQETARRDK